MQRYSKKKRTEHMFQPPPLQPIQYLIKQRAQEHGDNHKRRLGEAVGANVAIANRGGRGDRPVQRAQILGVCIWQIRE
jgi:hypothetical protein